MNGVSHGVVSTNQSASLSSEGHSGTVWELARAVHGFELVVSVSHGVVSTDQPAFSCLRRDIVKLYGHLHGLHVCEPQVAT